MYSGYGYGNYSTGGYNTTPFRQFDTNNDGLITSADFNNTSRQNGYGFVGNNRIENFNINRMKILYLNV